MFTSTTRAATFLVSLHLLAIAATGAATPLGSESPSRGNSELTNSDANDVFISYQNGANTYTKIKSLTSNQSQVRIHGRRRVAVVGRHNGVHDNRNDDDDASENERTITNVHANAIGHAGVLLPLIRTQSPQPGRRRWKSRDANLKESGWNGKRMRNTVTGAIGLGNAQDVTYNVLVQIGNTTTPLVLDTGSSDLWVLSSTCPSCFDSINDDRERPPLYPEEHFQSTDLPAKLHYGDSTTGTRAWGMIGSDEVSVAGLRLQEQYFAAINDTNTSVVDTGSAGIFGLGFPLNSVVWHQLYQAHLNATSAASNTSTTRRSLHPRSDLPSHRRLPVLPLPNLVSKFVSKAPTSNTTQPIPYLSSFARYGSFLSRFVLPNGSPVRLPSPEFSVTLQRTTPTSSGSTAGLLSLGSLPPGISNNSLSWAPVRLYGHGAEGGLKAPEAPEETYPFAWEAMLEDVWFDGVKLDRSTHGDSGNVSLSALIDTGNSHIRGPSDVVRSIFAMLARSTTQNSASDPSSNDDDRASAIISGSDTRATLARGLYPCSEAHTLSFQFGGRRFDVDPRDFGSQEYVDNVEICRPKIVATDPPTVGGYLYGWNLGDPFLRGVLTSFYYGNITHPSQDPPRIGFLSTVPENAAELLQVAVGEAKENGNNFPVTTIPAPTGTMAPFSTDANGVGSPNETNGPQASNSARGSSLSGVTATGAFAWTVVVCAVSVFFSSL